jgi:hypothetical protein
MSLDNSYPVLMAGTLTIPHKVGGTGEPFVHYRGSASRFFGMPGKTYFSDRCGGFL